MRTEALAAIAVLALTLLSTLALAASPPSLASRTVAYLPYPQGLQTQPPSNIPVSLLPPYGILLLFPGSSGSYLAMFNISNRDYRVIAHFGPNIVPTCRPAPLCCASPTLATGRGSSTWPRSRQRGPYLRSSSSMAATYAPASQRPTASLWPPS